MSNIFDMLNRRTLRAPVNPMDLSTVVSIFPKRIKIQNHTIVPGKFEIEPGSYEKPAVLVVGPSSWWKEVDPKEPLIEIPIGSVVIAESIVNDYCNGVFGCDMGDQKPGLFWVPGEHSPLQISTKFKDLLDRANTAQNNYYRFQLRTADHAWAASGGSPMVINEEMRVAARVLGHEDKDWMQDFRAEGNVRCLACGSMKDPRFPVCPTCRAIDPKHKDSKELKFADAK